MPDDASGHTDVWERLAAANRDGVRWPPPLTFRDENERLDFHIEMIHINILANIWKMTEHVKLLNKYLDRQTAPNSAERGTARASNRRSGAGG